jgi:acyl-CoA synthetase (AMP-forming)/AMP-acid ligase II
MNLAYLLRQAAMRFPDETGFAWGDASWSWAELDARVDAMCVVLRERGVVKGDRVLVQSKNCNQMFESMFACFRLGAVWVPTNYRQTPEEVAYLAQASGASVMLCHADFSGHAETAMRDTPTLTSLIMIGSDDSQADYDDLVAAHLGQASPMADVEQDDPCWYFFTSGTTGRPKAAVLTHGQLGFVVTSHLCDLMPATTHRDAALVVAPLSHGAGIHQLVQTARAAKTVLMTNERFDAEEAWRLVERWGITNLFTVPTILKLLVEHPAVDRYDHGSLRYVIYAGAPMYREDQKRAIKALGPVLVQYYGLGEVTGNITVLPPELHDETDDADARIGTCGHVRTAMQLSIQDAEGRELEVNDIGEICVCGPAVFAGYYGDDAANAKAFRNGWFRTGDLGYVDAQGFVYITGRSSDMFISGGSNVYPREIEEKILQHPDIAEVAIVGVPDRVWGEVGVAACVSRDGRRLSEGELLAWMEGRVARYKLPKRVVFWDALPKSAYGKTSKKLVYEALCERGVLPSGGEQPAHPEPIGVAKARDGARGTSAVGAE